MAVNDPYDLNRFLSAQSEIYDQVMFELAAGEKRSHWMWFIFPQIDGLGYSPTAQFYAIKSLDEARAYLRHPVLGSRLTGCTRLVNGIDGRTAHQIFGSPDDLKFHSSMTLFEIVAPPGSVFTAALTKFYSGSRDHATLNIVRSLSSESSP